MLLFMAVAVMGQLCEEVLSSHLSSDLAPRIKLFRSNEGGLDSVPNYLDCLNTPNSTYILVAWKLHEVILTYYGLPQPAQCTSQESAKVIDSFIQSNNFTHLISNEGYELYFVPINEPTISYQGIFFLSCFVLLLLTGIISTVFESKLEKSEFFKCFSMAANLNKLFSFSGNSGSLQFFDGIRAVCSFAIVALHYYLISFKIPSENRSLLLEKFTNSSNGLFFATGYSVDVFFFMAGTLMATGTLYELHRNQGKVNWLVFVLRRMVRYYPIYLFLVGFQNATVGLPLPSASILPTLCEVDKNKKDWVKSLVFLHGVLSSHNVIYLVWTWTITCDFFFYLVSCIIVNIYYHKKTVAYILIITIILFSAEFTRSVSYTNNLTPLFFETYISIPQMNLIYFNPLCRISPYLIGITFGFILSLNSQKSEKVSIAYKFQDSLADKFERTCSRLLNIQGVRCMFYISAIGILMILCLGPVCLDAGNWTLDSKANFLGSQRILTGLACFLLFLPCALGHLNCLSGFLSMKVFYLPAKLSYALYAVHPFIFSSVFMTGNEEKEWKRAEMICELVLFYCISVFVAGVLHVLVESPILALERKFFR